MPKKRQSITKNARPSLSTGREPESAGGGQKIITLNPNQAPTVYCSFAQANMNPWEIRLRICEVLAAKPSEVTIRESLHVVMAPAIAKAVRDLLDRALQKHEEAHGHVAAVALGVREE